MQQQSKIATLVNANALFGFIGLSAVATILPFIIHQQFITGPIVNAILILAVFVVGIRGALTLCLIPSLMALSGGLLPAILAPAVPFIMISNVVLVLAVDYSVMAARREETGYWVGVVTGALFKFLFLYASVNFIARLLPNETMAAKVAQMMGWPQFATALAGGILAWGILKWLKKF